MQGQHSQSHAKADAQKSWPASLRRALALGPEPHGGSAASRRGAPRVRPRSHAQAAFGGSARQRADSVASERNCAALRRGAKDGIPGHCRMRCFHRGQVRTYSRTERAGLGDRQREGDRHRVRRPWGHRLRPRSRTGTSEGPGSDDDAPPVDNEPQLANGNQFWQMVTDELQHPSSAARRTEKQGEARRRLPPTRTSRERAWARASGNPPGAPPMCP